MAINKDTLKLQAVEHIRQFILSGKIKPGDRVVPGDLALKLKVGRGSVREALIELEKEGLIETIPYKGTYVKTITEKEILEICSIRALLETYSIRSANHPAAKKDIQALTKIVERMHVAVQNNDARSIVKCDEKFHEYIINMAGNKILYESWAVTNSRLSALVYSVLTYNKLYSYEKMADNHQLIVDALQNGISHEEFEKLISEHYSNVLVYQNKE